LAELIAQIAGYAAVLLVAGVSFYLAKQRVEVKRKADLDGYRACELHDPGNFFLCYFTVVSLELSSAYIVQTEQNKKSSDGHAGGIQTKDSVS
jgi:hypothetical protein